MKTLFILAIVLAATSTCVWAGNGSPTAGWQVAQTKGTDTDQLKDRMKDPDGLKDRMKDTDQLKDRMKDTGELKDRMKDTGELKDRMK